MLLRSSTTAPTLDLSTENLEKHTNSSPSHSHPIPLISTAAAAYNDSQLLSKSTDFYKGMNFEQLVAYTMRRDVILDRTTEEREHFRTETQRLTKELLRDSETTPTTSRTSSRSESDKASNKRSGRDSERSGRDSADSDAVSIPSTVVPSSVATDLSLNDVKRLLRIEHATRLRAEKSHGDKLEKISDDFHRAKLEWEKCVLLREI